MSETNFSSLRENDARRESRTLDLGRKIVVPSNHGSFRATWSTVKRSNSTIVSNGQSLAARRVASESHSGTSIVGTRSTATNKVSPNSKVTPMQFSRGGRLRANPGRTVDGFAVLDVLPRHSRVEISPIAQHKSGRQLVEDNLLVKDSATSNISHALKTEPSSAVNKKAKASPDAVAQRPKIEKRQPIEKTDTVMPELDFNPFEPNSVEPGKKIVARESGLKAIKNAAKGFHGGVSKIVKSAKKNLSDAKVSAKTKSTEKTNRKNARAKSLEKLTAFDEGLLAATDFAAAPQTQSKQTFASELASAAETEQLPGPSIITTGGVAELTEPSFLDKFMNAKISFTFDINKKALLSGLRITSIVVILAVAGYLAWDTWVTNRSADSTTSQLSSSMSIAAKAPNQVDASAISQQQYSAYSVPADQPRYIQIPSINVNARILNVGVTSSGNIDVPTNLNDTAWYDGSAKPGQQGQVFIDGHNGFGKSAVFNDLSKLKAGDVISVQTGSGTNYNYRVTSTEKVAVSKVDMSKALNTQNGADKGLTLMTCAGEYNYRTQDASERFIVYATQE